MPEIVFLLNNAYLSPRDIILAFIQLDILLHSVKAEIHFIHITCCVRQFYYFLPNADVSFNFVRVQVVLSTF